MLKTNGYFENNKWIKTGEKDLLNLYNKRFTSKTQFIH